MEEDKVTRKEYELQKNVIEQEIKSGFQNLDQKMGVLVGKIDNVDRKVDRIERILYGNGRRGLVASVSETEEKVDRIERDMYQEEGVMFKIKAIEVKVAGAVKIMYVLLGGFLGLFFWLVRGFLLK